MLRFRNFLRVGHSRHGTVLVLWHYGNRYSGHIRAGTSNKLKTRMCGMIQSRHVGLIAQIMSNTLLRRYCAHPIVGNEKGVPARTQQTDHLHI